MNPERRRPASCAPAQLRTGDVLLLRHRNELARLYAWLGDSDYDHAVLVGRAGCLIELCADGVVEPALAERLADPDLSAAEARRPQQAGGEAAQDTDRIAVLAHALSLRKPAHAGDPLRALGVLAALRERDWPAQPGLRRVLYEALRRVAETGAEAMTASEFVYRCLAENPVHARDRSVWRLPPVPSRMRPCPDLDEAALWARIEPWLSAARRRGWAEAKAEADMGEAAFAVALAQARARLGLIATGAGLLAAGPRVANPKWLRLRELELSPSLPALGALLAG
ncbi:hypothetical protein [Lysobacter antibioticus]|uniref:hypothetical protein n=1 Tax=Lysobacter antibioticus TaxID=84531 RepID=UPI00034BF8F4|nr:hypothetical protein [Lysobacter antibioticus]